MKLCAKYKWSVWKHWFMLKWICVFVSMCTLCCVYSFCKSLTPWRRSEVYLFVTLPPLNSCYSQLSSFPIWNMLLTCVCDSGQAPKHQAEQDLYAAAWVKICGLMHSLGVSPHTRSNQNTLFYPFTPLGELGRSFRVQMLLILFVRAERL